jgi:catechol 2,3-dioxygenase-like lactoylglutathione lyase family enzyme
MNRSREFYEGVLQQKVKHDFGENVSYEGDFAIHLKSHFKGLINNAEIRSGCNNFELYFEDDDVEGINMRLKANKVRFVHEVREQPWRQKVLRFYDPDGNMIEVGESLENVCRRLSGEGLSIHEICRATSMPEEFVLNSIHTYD